MKNVKTFYKRTKHVFNTIALVFLLSTGSSAQIQSPFKVADILQSNMVVQQNKPFKIWGDAVAGEEVTVTADWAAPVKVTAIEDGSFMAIVDVPAISSGDFSQHSILIEAGQKKIFLENILIGEVWICSGQSNMQFKLEEDKDASTELPSANNEYIRLFSADLNFSAAPEKNIKGKWQLCTPEVAKSFSAVGYYFGKFLFAHLNIPVGLVFSGIGASKVEAFIPREVLAENAFLDSAYLKPYLDSPKSREIINSGFSFEKVTRPFLLYNALINPLKNLSIKGFCWYQGESNRSEREVYTLATKTLIKSWRNKFGQGELPFYYIQVAPFFYDKEDPVLNDYAFFREAQEHISSLNNTGMVVSMDVGEAKNLHPNTKKPLGIRLSKLALNRTYGLDSVIYQGPHYQFIEVKGKDAIIHFELESVKNGLETSNGKSPDFFTIAGADRKFYPAVAKIKGNTVVVSSAAVGNPVAVRYAFTNYPVTNLQNRDGMPAVPFRTDNWPENKD